MGENFAYIRTGLGQTTVTKAKPFCLPFFHSLEIFDLNTDLNIKGSISLGIISKDQFFLDLNCSMKITTAFDKEIILKAQNQGKNRLEILQSSILESLRTFANKHLFVDLTSMKGSIKNILLGALKSEGIEDLEILNLNLERTGLDDYDLNNIIHFKTAKEIVTRIARVQIKDKEFIDKCRKTIAHFDIVDE